MTATPNEVKALCERLRVPLALDFVPPAPVQEIIVAALEAAALIESLSARNAEMVEALKKIHGTCIYGVNHSSEALAHVAVLARAALNSGGEG